MPDRDEVIRKVQQLVETRFSGSYEVAFNDYSHEGYIDIDRLKTVLRDADIGNAVTRIAIARAVMNEIDINKDGFISWPEFQSALQRSA